MKKKLIIILTFLSILACSRYGQSQIDLSEYIPLDKEIRYGKLSNGTTYYIRSNKNIKERADFYLVNAVGAVYEEDNQNGLAHFLEHMAFNGTKNFPNKLLINYFESVGVKFGPNINAYTTADQTVLYLTNVPLNHESIMDTALLALHDWSGFLSLDDAEIDMERGVIREEWRTRRNSEVRMSSAIDPIIYKGSKYAVRDVLGNINVINNFEYSTLKDFYVKWYRPDLQAIVIVGDVDVDSVEAKVKSVFSDISKPQLPLERLPPEVPDNDEPLIAIASDPEAQFTFITLRFKQRSVDKGSKNLEYYRKSLIKTFIVSMINMRLSEVAQSVNPPFVFANCSRGGMVQALDPININIAPKNDSVILALKGAVREVERIKRYGFTKSELERTKAVYLSNVERRFNEKNEQDNDMYVYQCVNHFLSGDPVPGIEEELRIANLISKSIGVSDVNSVVSESITERNILVSITGSKSAKELKLNEADILKSILDIRLEKIDPYLDNFSSKPLFEKSNGKGRVINITEDKQLGCEIWKLSNGATVIIKKTDFKSDEIILSAFSQGGLSMADLSILPSAMLAHELVLESGVANFSNVELRKKNSGKVVRVTPYISDNYEGFTGNSSPKDFETMLQLVNLYFTSPREDLKAFKNFMESGKSFVSNVSSNPSVIFADSVKSLIANRSSRIIPVNLQYMEKVDYKKSIGFYRDRFADASDFTYILVGNINTNNAKDLIEEYIASLPSLNRNEKVMDNGVRPPIGVVKNYFTRKLQTPKSSICTAYTGHADYSEENIILMDIVSNILSTRYNQELREKEGATYFVDVDASILVLPFPSFKVEMKFDTDSRLQDKMIGLIHSTIKQLKNDGPTQLEVDKAKEYLLKEYDQNKKNNNYWARALRKKYEYGIDVNSNYVHKVNSITRENITRFAESIFSQGNIVEVVMSPEEQK